MKRFATALGLTFLAASAPVVPQKSMGFRLERPVVGCSSAHGQLYNFTGYVKISISGFSTEKEAEKTMDRHSVYIQRMSQMTWQNLIKDYSGTEVMESTDIANRFVHQAEREFGQLQTDLERHIGHGKTVRMEITPVVPSRGCGIGMSPQGIDI